VVKSDTFSATIRRPNFSGDTTDVPHHTLIVRVGNELKEALLERIKPQRVVSNIEGYIKNSKGIPVENLYCKKKMTRW
jgi:hypothetical protein